MEESQGVNHHDHQGEPESKGINRGMVLAAVALLAIAVVAFGYGYRQQVMVGHLTARESAANATINNMQGQLTTLTAKLNEMSAAQQAAADAAAQKKAPAGHAATPGAKPNGRKSGAPPSKQLKKLRPQLDQQPKLLSHTPAHIAKNPPHPHTQ